ncbi:hypothetical protein PR048_005370 [Dryococelus australis]|uniref:Uncharacterized protein n=1 Tax=Dryococelus australis TaxID=614101 RepID=A0ABQ9I810_9NEOP|nr:hypothetical protein PR048_005370 [Dryococelus australis]
MSCDTTDIVILFQNNLHKNNSILPYCLQHVMQLLNIPTLLPVCSTQNPVPQYLLNIISCGYKAHSSRNCEYARAGLNCSDMRSVCQGLSCMNCIEASELSDGEIEDTQ